jgi:hypothetical protein
VPGKERYPLQLPRVGAIVVIVCPSVAGRGLWRRIRPQTAAPDQLAYHRPSAGPGVALLSPSSAPVLFVRRYATVVSNSATQGWPAEQDWQDAGLPGISR